jgi:hypothetical protein
VLLLRVFYYGYNNKEKTMKAKFLNEAECCRLSIPLILRLFEYIREEPVSDEDLHFMAERISEMCDGGVRLTMNHYESIIPREKMVRSEKITEPSYEHNQTTHIE